MTSHLTGPSGASAPLRERIVRAGGWVTAGFVLEKLIGMVQLAILARLLAPSDFGLMAASAVVLLGLLTLSELGLEPALVTKARPQEQDLAVAWTLALGRAAVLATCLWLSAGAVATFFHAPDLAALVRVHAVALFIQAARSPALALLAKNLELGRRVRLDLARRAMEAMAAVGLAWWLHNAWALLGGQLVGFAVGCALSYRIAPFRPRFSLDHDALTHFLRFGKYFNLTTILIFGVTSGGEFVIGRILGTEALGVYQVALAIPALIGTRIAFVMNEVSFPTYALVRSNPPDLLRVFGLQVGLFGLGIVPLATALAVTAEETIPFLFGSRWTAAIEPFQILCLFAVLAAFSFMMSTMHFGVGRPEFQARIWAIQFGVYVAAIVPLTQGFGLVGAALALVLAYAFGLALQAWYTLAVLGKHAWSVLRSLARNVAVAIAIGGGLVVIRHAALTPAEAWATGIFVLSMGILYVRYISRVEYPRLAGLWRGE